MSERAKLNDFLQGNADAVEMITLLGEISQTWDDLIDQDKGVSRERISNAFIKCLSTLPRNAFYREYQLELLPVIEMAMLDWLSANDLEAGNNRHELSLAYVLRDSLIAVLIRAMTLIGGLDYARRRGAEVRAYFHDETLEDYLQERRS
jgi:hypothetical protein